MCIRKCEKDCVLDVFVKQTDLVLNVTMYVDNNLPMRKMYLVLEIVKIYLFIHLFIYQNAYSISHLLDSDYTVTQQ